MRSHFEPIDLLRTSHPRHLWWSTQPWPVAYWHHKVNLPFVNTADQQLDIHYLHCIIIE